jgi:arylsulfatase A-like enzyme
MNNKLYLSRREIIKLLSLLPLTYFLPALSKSSFNNEKGSKQRNVLIIVFDALSASNMSLYGYHRNTTPKLLELSKQATVYHNHYASANWTIPGTASLLTGTHPWTHRALKRGVEVTKKFETRNIFNLFSHHHRFAYTHNFLVDKLLDQFQNDIEHKENLWKLFLISDRIISNLFSKDVDTISVLERLALDTSDGSTYSLFLPRVIKGFLEQKGVRVLEDYAETFPRGLPSFFKNSRQFYILEDAIDWLLDTVEGRPHPIFGYIHLLPPHFPYRTRKEFIDIFEDGWKPIEKPRSFFQRKGYSEEKAVEKRRHYDEYIPYVDAEFYRFFDLLHQSGFLENTIVVFTTDHGEIFERGQVGHDHPFMYEPAIHIPLVIFHPEQKERIDVVSPTSAVDLLPTLLHETGQPIPSWCEGEVLPPFNKKAYPPDRSIFALEAKYNRSSSSPITRATGMIVKGKYKLTHYFGYDELPNGEPIIELFDLDNDPEELENLYLEKESLAKDLFHELESRMKEADEPYK